MFETCQKSQCSLITPMIPLWLWVQTLNLLTWTQLFFPEVTDWVWWGGSICHTSKRVLQPILWNALPVVTACLKEISGVTLILKNSGQWSTFRKLSHFSVSEKMCVLCIHLLTELYEQTWVKGMYCFIILFIYFWLCWVIVAAQAVL